MKNLKAVLIIMTSLFLAACGDKGGGSPVGIGNGTPTNQYVNASGQISDAFINSLVNGQDNVGTISFQPDANVDQMVRNMMFGVNGQQRYEINGVQHIDIFVDMRTNSNQSVLDQNYLNQYRGQFKALVELADSYTDTYNLTDFIHVAYAEGQMQVATANASAFHWQFGDSLRIIEVVYNPSSQNYEMYVTVSGQGRTKLGTAYKMCGPLTQMQIPMVNNAGYGGCINLNGGYY